MFWHNVICWASPMTNLIFACWGTSLRTTFSLRVAKLNSSRFWLRIKFVSQRRKLSSLAGWWTCSSVTRHLCCNYQMACLSIHVESWYPGARFFAFCYTNWYVSRFGLAPSPRWSLISFTFQPCQNTYTALYERNNYFIHFARLEWGVELVLCLR